MLIFLGTNVIFCTKKLNIVRRIQFWRRMSFSPGTVAANALWKSAPVGLCFIVCRYFQCDVHGRLVLVHLIN